MASLDGKITIEIKLRPCIVHIPEKRQNYRKKGDNLNVYDKVIEPEKDIKPYFTVGIIVLNLSESPIYVAVILPDKYLEHLPLLNMRMERCMRLNRRTSDLLTG